MGIRILHTGDLHIGSFPGPEVNGENARFRDICKCLDALVETAEKEKPDVAVVAGDVFHQARVWSDRGLREQQTAVEFIRRLEDICPVVVMRGTANHDSEEQFSTLRKTFENDDSVHIVTEPGVETYYTYEGRRVQIACLPGFDRGYFRTQHPGLSKEEENTVFTEYIENMIMGLKAMCDPAMYTVLVSHYTITGCNMESGQTAFFSQFEPVVYPPTLTAANFDLVCFGHIHRPQPIEGCSNTFYCGAISALNFNDEGQQRGFYIHEIKQHGQVESRFFPLPTREYKTVRLNDDDVREINENGPGWLYRLPLLEEGELKDKVVRVLYDCTDEHNKAFNHAALEKWMYDTGKAFWVQEITPQKISITVDKRSMESDNTPESNLVDYLTEKEYGPERVADYVELARPIISEVTEKAATERRTGTFVPVEIEVKNYRNYREEKFSFDDISFCMINGENGVGKSSLFMDAIVDCLYEETREGEITGWICNDPNARSGAIKFTFRLGEQLFRVTRTRQKSGKATLNISEMVDGEWADRSKEKLRDTQQEIINIIGMDSLTLKACALIMQDQYGLFLQADKEARMNILGNILGLGIYDGMEEMAALRLTETNREIRTLNDQVTAIQSGIPDQIKLEEAIEEAEKELEELRKEEQEKTAAVDTLKVQLNTQTDAAGRVMKLNSKAESLAAQKATKESLKSAQAATMMSADAVLSKETEITEGVKQYNGYLEQEKEAIKAKAEYDSLRIQKGKATDNLKAAEQEAETARKRREDWATKVAHIKLELERTSNLTAIHEEYTETEKRIRELEALEPGWTAKKEAVTAAEKDLQSMEAAGKDTITICNYRVSRLKEKLRLLENSGCPNIEKASCKFLSDALAAKAELPEAEEALRQAQTKCEDDCQNAQNRLKSARKDLDGDLYDPDELKRLKGRLRDLVAGESDYNNLTAKRKELELLLEREKEYEEAVEQADKAVEEYRTECAQIRGQLWKCGDVETQYMELKNRITETQVWLEKEKQLPVAREKKQAAAERYLELTEEIEQIGRDIESTKEELQAEQLKTVGISELRAKVETAEAEITVLKEAEQDTYIRLGGLQKQEDESKESRNRIKELQKNVEKEAVLSTGYEVLKTAFSQDGIPHNIIRSIIPIFEATATNILGQMSGGKMSVEFVTEKVLKSNSKKEVTTLDILINDCNTGRLPYMSRSGGERVKAALSVILALSEIKSNKAGVQLGMLFVDEPPFLDEQGTQAYCDALETIQKRYPDLKIMAITHDPAMKSRFPQSLTVTKDENGSHAVME